MRPIIYAATLAAIALPWTALWVHVSLQAQSQEEPLFDLVKTVGPMAFTLDYDLTIGDCVSRWADFDPADKLSCERVRP